MTKSAYQKPTLRAHGSVEAMTKGSNDGNFTDADFPTTTPFSQITFS